MPGNVRTNRSQRYAVGQIVSFANLSNEVSDIVRIYVNPGLLLLILERCVRQLRSMSSPAYWVFDLWAIVTFMMELNIGINYNDYLSIPNPINKHHDFCMPPFTASYEREVILLTYSNILAPCSHNPSHNPSHKLTNTPFGCKMQASSTTDSSSKN